MSDVFFFFNDPATTEIYTLPLHDALPISLRQLVERHLLPHLVLARRRHELVPARDAHLVDDVAGLVRPVDDDARSEEHTSELQSQSNLVCRLLLEKTKTTRPATAPHTPLR